MNEIKTKEGALGMRRRAYKVTIIYFFISFIVLIVSTLLNDLKLMIAGVLSFIFVVLLFIDMRYWDLRYHALK